MMQIVTDIKLIDRKAWSSFVSQHPDGNIFQTPEMYDVYCQSKKNAPVFVGVLNQKNEIVGVLVANIQREHKGILGIFSARSIIAGGPLIKNDDPTILHICLTEYNKAVKHKVIYSQIRNFKALPVTFTNAFNSCDFKFFDHLNIVLDLSGGKNILWDNFSKSRRKGIQKAIKNEYTFHPTNEMQCIPQFHALLCSTYQRIKLPFPNQEHFFNIAETLQSDSFKLFQIRKQNRIIAALFVLMYEKSVYGYYVGSQNDHEELKNKPLDLLYWEVFKWAIDNDYKFFDWQGAGKPNQEYGVRDFKLQFGGATQNFGRFQKIHKPILMQLSKFIFFLWQKLKK